MAINLLTVERPGILDMQKEACLEIVDILKSPVSDCLSDEIEFSIFLVLAGISVTERPVIRELAFELISIANSKDIRNLIEEIDKGYINFFKISDYLQFTLRTANSVT